MNITHIIVLGLAGVVLAGCDVFGSKDDMTTDEIFEAGRNDPTSLEEVEYVPLFPFFQQSFSGTFDAPQDVYVGYDEFIYVADGQGVHVLDLSGQPQALINIPGGGTSVIQDRRLNLYVTARRDTTLAGRTWSLPVVLRYEGVSTGAPRLADIIWHPFDDDSRRFNRPDPVDTDEEVEFTGVGVLHDNHIYVSRRGPTNERLSVIFPHNIVLEFDDEGNHVRAIVALNPSTESLRSAINPTDVATYVHPPQRGSFPQTRHFLLAQSPGESALQRLRFATLAIQVEDTPDGRVFLPNTTMIQTAGNPDAGQDFLYREQKFSSPSDITVAADGTNYIFVTDAGSDSLFIFTSLGVEGVAPPPGATSTRPVPVSFGGTGDGAREFDNPQGVAYFEEIVYVADAGNNRIARFRLNTDFD